MKKVVNTFFHELTAEQRKQYPYCTGLVLELEDGSFGYGVSTDVLQQIERDFHKRF